jgi:hypothetical protein
MSFPLAIEETSLDRVQLFLLPVLGAILTENTGKAIFALLWMVSALTLRGR